MLSRDREVPHSPALAMASSLHAGIQDDGTRLMRTYCFMMTFNINTLKKRQLIYTLSSEYRSRNSCVSQPLPNLQRHHCDGPAQSP